jgi:ABC-type Fe3+-hydroxamate transport system substrate-binding protein
MSVGRIVCLVPSLTETLVDFGLLDRLVGRTRYCTEPAAAVAAVETVGGTKNPDVGRIIELDPDLVVLNKEENRIEDYRALAAAGLELFVTHPRSVAEAASMLAGLGRAAGADDAGRRLAAACTSALAQARERASRQDRAATFCPIWRNPWMTFHRETYVGDVLRTVGFDNVFAGRGDGPDFFTVTLDEVAARSPELALLPDEPYVFGAEHAAELLAAGVCKRAELIDGKDLSWYGPRLPAALRRLSTLASATATS